MAQRASIAVAHGALQRLPYVRTALEILEMKFWRASVSECDRIGDPIKRAKNHTARCINMHLGKLSNVTRQASLNFPALRHMHPFEQEVVMLTLGEGTYEKHIQILRNVYALLHNTGKKFELECHELRTKKEATDCGLRCMEELKKAVNDNADKLQEVASMVKVLRGLPVVDLDKPIFAFVGAANVGKSSLVRALSTASPEVANYPFTTRGITIGHIFVEGISYQIADTPGLIYRPNKDRNAIEKLAIAMLVKTQASIGFVFDPTGSSGTPSVDQILLRDELRHRVAKARPHHKWIDIISKIDQPSEDLVSLQHRLSPHYSVSTETNEGLIQLSNSIRQVLTDSAC